ncbi:hypothetical protein RRM36_001794 [Salmonella enterica]|nr:hypothetical protein [Salmonella enterica subsp. enterica serovar Sandiego]EFB0085067.1 hypothetical protein [Salmonella enterica]ELG4133852.1 hypothetical protein [Salmonella enterica]ELI6305978.1 hypothetical protein [Salmonella enterica]ELI6350515.1 hypothetical protein [Salmonella enterica]
MPTKPVHPVIKQQIECLVNQLRQSGLLKNHSELRLTESAFDEKLNEALYKGIIDYNRGAGRRGPAGVAL